MTTESKFEFRFREFEYSHTRRGINCVCPIRLKDGPIVGHLYDKAESIVAPVDFSKPEYKQAFLEEAKELLPKDRYLSAEMSDEMFLSEYARIRSMQAEEAN